MKADPRMFAIEVFHSSSDIERTLGGKEKVEFSVNGKQVRARRLNWKNVS